MSKTRRLNATARRRVVLIARLLAGVAVLAALAFAVAPADKAPARPTPLAYRGEVLGVTANSLDDNTPAVQDAAKRLGVRWIREEFRWPTLEPAEGRFDFRRYDSLLTDAAKRGLRVLPVLIQSPQWLSPQPNRLPTRLDRWENFVKVLVRRYGTHGKFWKAHPQLDQRLALSVWEIWNEPYLSVFDDLGPRPGQYAQLVRATALAGRSVDPRARFLTAAETTYAARNGGTRNWVRDMDAAVPGLGAWVDLLAVHPYTPASPLAQNVPRNQQFGRIADLQQTLVDVGIGRRPMWLTELGWSTCTTSPPCVSNAQQARYWKETLELVATDERGQVAAIFPYRLADITGTGEGDSQAKFGLVTLDKTRKPAYDVVRRAAAAAAGKG